MDFISLYEVAQCLHCSRQHARRLALQHLTCYQPGGAGGKILIDRAEFEAWVRSSRPLPAKKSGRSGARRTGERRTGHWLDVSPDGRLIA